MKTNLVFVGLLNDKTRKLAEKFALDMELYFADLDKIVEYNLFNIQEIQENCGVEYFNKLKQQVIKDVSTYENTLIYLPFDMFIEGKNAEYFNKYGTTVFLDFDKKIVKQFFNGEPKSEADMFFLNFVERREFLKKEANITIEIQKDDFQKNLKNIKKIIENYYL